MKVSEVSAYLQVHVMTVYRWLKIGEIPGFKIGSNWRVKKSELDKCLSEKGV